MIHETKSLWQRITATVLAVILAVGMTPAIIAGTMEEPKPKLVLVSFGDSMTNGYGHENYYQGDEQVNGFRQSDVETTYPALLKAYLGAQYDVTWEQLAISCMRPEDINFLLNFKVGEWDGAANTVAGKGSWNDAKTTWNSTFVNEAGDVLGDFYTWDEFVTGRFKDWGKVDNGLWDDCPTAAYAEYFQDAVKDADVITLGVGNSNFGVIAIRNLLAALGMSFGDFAYRDVAVSTEEFLIDRLDEDVLPFALLALEQVKEIVAKTCEKINLDAEKIEKLTHSLVYTTMSMLVNYWEMLCAIDELNDKDNLDIIMVDLISTMEDCSVILPDGKTFDFGECLSTLFDVISACIFAMPVIRQDVGNFEDITFYAVPNDNAIEMLNVDMSDLDAIKEPGTVLRDRMIGSFVDTILPILGMDKVDVEGTEDETVSVPEIDREFVEKYVDARNKLSPEDGSDPDYVGALTIFAELADKVAAIGEAAGNEAYGLNNDPDKAKETGENVAAAYLGSIAAYVAFEKAIAANANNTTIDLRNLLPLFGEEGELGAAFAPLLGALTPAVGPTPTDDQLKAARNAVRKSVLTDLELAVELTDSVKNQISLDIKYLEGKIKTLPTTASDAKGRLELLVKLLKAVEGDVVIPKLDSGNLDITAETFKTYYDYFGDVDEWFDDGTNWYDLKFDSDNGTYTYTENPFILQMDAIKAKLGDAYYGEPGLDLAEGTYKKNDSFSVILAPYYAFLESMNPLMSVEASLTDALTNAENPCYVAAVGDLLNLFARMIIGDGIGSHPSVNGHKTIFANILKVYGNDIRAKELLRERVWNAELEFCNLVAEYGPEAFEKVLAYAVSEGYISAEQAAQLKAVATDLVNAINAGDAEAIAYNSALIAGGVYMFALSEGWIPGYVYEFLNEAIDIYAISKDMTEEDFKALLCDIVKALVDKYGDDVLGLIEEYILSEFDLTIEDVKALHDQITALIAAYKADPEGTKEALVIALVATLYKIGVENYIIDPEVLSEAIHELLELKKYIAIMNTPVSDGPIENYVSLGASFTNGYGLLGYYGDADLAELALDSTCKKNANIYGYGTKAADSYPSIIAKALDLDDYAQLAISSMRIEEARLLLEDAYEGDSYSAWRFLGEGNWFDIADGVKDGNYQSLSNEYKDAIAAADLITIDLGMNNFGVYLASQFTNGFALDNDIAKIDPAVGVLYAQMKDYVAKLVGEKYPEINAADYEQIVDTLAYALIGYCFNFDRVMNDIYTLNPDVQVVVVSIQNLLDGLKLDLGGIEIDLGYLTGALINVANTYMAVGSPYAAKYLVADVRKDGHVELNADVIARYNGDPSTLSAEMKACFDILDGNAADSYNDDIHIQYTVHNYLAKNWKYIYALAVDAQNYNFATSTKYFDAYDGVGDTTTLDSFLAIDFDEDELAAGLTDDDRDNLATIQAAVAAKYSSVVNTAYDAFAEILAAAAKVDTLTYSGFKKIDAIQTKLANALKAELATVIGAAVENASYTYTLDADFFADVAEACGVSEADVLTVAALSVRTTIGNSFFAHPSKAGHAEMAEIICETLVKKTTGKDVIKNEIEFAAKKLYEAAVAFGTAAFEAARQYVIDNGYATVEELAALSAIIDKVAGAIAANDEAALKAACNEFAALAYTYADVRGYIPGEAKLVLAKILAIYDCVKETTVEEIKAQIAEQIVALIKAQTPAALIALRSYIASEGWMTEEEMTALDEQVAAIIAAYKVDPEGTTNLLISDLAAFLYATAVAEGYIDPAKIAEAVKLVETVKAAYDYFVNTPEEQLKADAINTLFAMIDKLAPEYIDEKTAAQIKSDILTLIYIAENYTADELIEIAKQYVEQQKALYELLLALATHGYYIPTEDSYYVALGGGTVYGLGIGRSDKTYTEIVAEYYGVKNASFGKEILLPTEILEYVVANAAELSKADLITYQLDASAFILSVMNEKDLDWNNYFTDEQLDVVNATLDVILEVLNDDWNKYVAWDAEAITEALKANLIAKLASVHGAIYEKLAAGNAEIEAVYDTCVNCLKWFTNFLQEKATIAAQILISEIKWVDELFVKIENELAKTEYESIDWLCIKEGEAEAIVDAIAAKIFAVEGAIDAKTREIISAIVAEIVKLHAATNAKLAAFDDRLNAKEHVMEAKLFNLIKECVVAEWPYFEGKTAADVHNDIFNCVKAAVNAKKEEFESFINANVDDIDAIIEYYTAVAIEYVEYAFANINGAVGMVKAKHEEFKAMVKPYLDAVLLENWAAIVGHNADFVKQLIENAVEAKLSAADATIRAYVDANAAEFECILSCVINEIQAVVGAAQAQKAKVADIVNGLEPAYGTIEEFLYAIVAYAAQTNAAVDAIRAINPDATFVVVGMYNPLAGLTVEYDGQSIDVGTYADYFVELTNAFYANLAIVKGNYTFVAVPATETNGFADVTISLDEIEINKIGAALISLYSKMHADAEGQAYIAEQIINALYVEETCDHIWVTLFNEDGHWDYCSNCFETTEVAPHVYDDEHDLYCNECGYKRVITGDFNADGYVDKDDAVYLLYNSQFPTESEYKLNQNGDLDGDDKVTYNDAIYLLYHTLYGEEEYPLVKDDPIAD